MRQLKYHEQKLLKKVDFLQWKQDGGLREGKVLRRYHVQDRDDYHKYNRLCGAVTKIVARIKALPAGDEFRERISQELLDKLHGLGVIHVKKLASCERLAVSAFCRRRLPVVLARLRYAETVREACELVEQGHIRVGPETVTDPAFLVTRQLEDLVSWVDTSKIRRHVLRYNDQLDDYDLL